MLIILLGNDGRMQTVLLDQIKASILIISYHFCKVHKPTRIKRKKASMRLNYPDHRLCLDGKTYR